MPFASHDQLQLLSSKYQNLDPSKHSFNEHFGLIKKRSSLQNFLHRLISILTFGIRSANPSLDRATKKLIGCARDVLMDSKFGAKPGLHRILSLHLSVVRHNHGCGEAKLQKLLSAIQFVEPFAKRSSRNNPPDQGEVAYVPVSQRITPEGKPSKEKLLMQFFEDCCRGDRNQFAKLPQASEAAAVWPRTLALLREQNWPQYQIELLPYELQKAAASLILKPETEKRRYLLVIAKLMVLSMPSWQSCYCEDPAWWELFQTGDCDFQARTIKNVMEQYLDYSDRTEPYLRRLSTASTAAWRKAGETTWFNVWNHACLRRVFQSQRPEALIAFANGSAANPAIDPKGCYVSQFLAQMMQPDRETIPAIDTWPWEQLSDEAWAFFDSSLLVPGSKRNPPDRWENKDFLWYGLSRHLNHPQTERQKRVFLWFSQQFLKRDPALFWEPHVRSFFEALTPADIALMPLEKHLPTHRFHLALRSQALKSHGALLRRTARELTAQEITDLLVLFQRYPLTLQDKIDLVTLLKDPSQAAQPPIVQLWMQEVAAHMDPLVQGFTDLVEGGQWQPAWDFAQALDERTRDYLFGALRQQSLPQGNILKELSKPLFFMALFDPKARGAMSKMLQEGRTEDGFTRWAIEMKSLLQRAGLPEVVRKTIAHFFKGVRRAVHVGSLKCPLWDQYNNPAFADLAIQLHNEQIPAHRALLRLDPFFNAFLSPQKEVRIPLDKVQEAHLRLKWLYNHLTISEIAKPETQLFLQNVKNNKPSFAGIFNQQDACPDIVVKGEDGQEGVHAHRFVLASAFPFFRGLFRTPMRDAASPEITMKEMTQDQVQAVLNYLYTGEKPEFADMPSEQAFHDAWKFFASSSKPAPENHPNAG